MIKVLVDLVSREAYLLDLRTIDKQLSNHMPKIVIGEHKLSGVSSYKYTNYSGSGFQSHSYDFIYLKMQPDWDVEFQDRDSGGTNIWLSL